MILLPFKTKMAWIEGSRGRRLEVWVVLKTLYKIIEEIRARKVHPVFHSIKGKNSFATHFNQVPICFFNVKGFFIAAIMIFQFECL